MAIVIVIVAVLNREPKEEGCGLNGVCARAKSGGKAQKGQVSQTLKKRRLLTTIGNGKGGIILRCI